MSSALTGGVRRVAAKAFRAGLGCPIVLESKSFMEMGGKPIFCL
jgi:hypothetical protein